MNILVFGKTGQVAMELQRRAPDARYLGRADADLTDPEKCAALITDISPDLVINAAAYTAVDKAEDDVDTARLVNGTTPGAIANACAQGQIPFVHVSTDYVFDGSGSDRWQVGDETGPLGVYGQTKREGEELVLAAGGASAILRTSWVFSSHGNNFVKTMLRLSESRDALNIVDDQIGGPTPAGDIAAALLEIGTQLAAAPDKAGLYHFAGQPDTSWKGFAEEIFAQAGRQVAVSGIPTSDYPTPARRPLNSRLDGSALEKAFGIATPDWKAGLARVLKELEVTPS
ncbi:dTDP-4-dehydrorhamnose reductase [Parvularcula flava]|uniref:dTDP-4-dehydrorhamnose reductase n=1 Tax=Aquisalinus luteolus TaxID=1566827 RepID=A0A8J3AB24_9PROT|nr:dTDP-4-dehydrorhamnose reductase [Aquisalinus luteolus]NHK29523.1 dTDP-4-dehydrorhamnose reductase [Aquisalinus luteolus]GGI01682.1 NAD(P)-dependent oxidoreductase [Aquisalinus luteolus]